MESIYKKHLSEPHPVHSLVLARVKACVMCVAVLASGVGVHPAAAAHPVARRSCPPQLHIPVSSPKVWTWGCNDDEVLGRPGEESEPRLVEGALPSLACSALAQCSRCGA